VGKPFGVALDGQENVYVTDQTAMVVRVFTRDGEPLRTFGRKVLKRPTGIAVDRERGRGYVSDSAWMEGERNYVRIFDLEGGFIGNVGEGKDGAEYRYFPTYLAVDEEGRLYVTDTLNGRVLVYDAEGNFVRQLGQPGTAWGNFDKPKGVYLDTFGNIYVVDSGWSNVQIFNKKGQVLLFFGGRSRYPGLMENPTGIAIDRNNTIYVADTYNFRVNVYQLVNTTAEDSFLTPE
jgi:DNA-binding beta-propeller fold protein YncE